MSSTIRKYLDRVAQKTKSHIKIHPMNKTKIAIKIKKIGFNCFLLISSILLKEKLIHECFLSCKLEFIQFMSSSWKILLTNKIKNKSRKLPKYFSASFYKFPFTCLLKLWSHQLVFSIFLRYKYDVFNTKFTFFCFINSCQLVSTIFFVK
jgi:hypothetical protein